jgi:hypothetical protein
MQKDVLIGRQFPGDLRARKFPRDVDFDRAQSAEAVKRGVNVADELLVGFGQTIIP